MNILLLGSNYFEKALTGMGHRVVHVGADSGADPFLPDLIAGLKNKPDVVVLTDDLGRRMIPGGLYEIDIPKIWYAVDSPINNFWQKHYAGLFDFVFVDQKDQAAVLNEATPCGADWLPVGIDTSIYRSKRQGKVHDLAFVGEIDDRVRPKRSRIIKLLSERFDVFTAGGRNGRWVAPGEAAKIYGRSRLVLNENLFPGVTTRMLEAMASGTMLLAERTRNGLSDLFVDGEDLALFGPGDLIERAEYYIGRKEERENIAARGREKALALHDIRNRAMELVRAADRIGGGSQPDRGTFLRKQGKVLFLTGLRKPGQNGWARILEGEKQMVASRSLGAADAEALLFLGGIAAMKSAVDGLSILPAISKMNESVDMGSLRARLALAFIELGAARHSWAADHFRKAADIYGLGFPPGLGNGLNADHHFAIGKILEKAGHVLEPGFSKIGLSMMFWNAAEHYQAALKINPDHVPALQGLGEILINKGAFVEAYPFLRKAAVLRPGNADLAEACALAEKNSYIFSEEKKRVA